MRQLHDLAVTVYIHHSIPYSIPPSIPYSIPAIRDTLDHMVACSWANEKEGNGNKMRMENENWRNGNRICTKSCISRDDSEVTVILFTNRTRDD